MSDAVTVIMACHNCAATLPAAVDSILAQTYENRVMVCCDDGSTDGTHDILLSYRNRYPAKFTVLRNDENRRLPYSLNRCLARAETPLIARMDGDDVSRPERFERQVRFLREHPACDLVGTGVTVTDGENRLGAIIKTPEPTRETMLRENAFSHATIMTYKRVYDALGGYSLDPSAERVEDVDLWCRFLAAGFRGCNLPDELYAITESPDAARRRDFHARLNSARTRSRGYRLLGYRGLTLVRPYLLVLRALVPAGLYRRLHLARIRSGAAR